MNYNREQYHELLTNMTENCALRLEALQTYTRIVLTQEKRLSDDSSQYIAAIEAALVKINRAIRAVSEANAHINKAKGEMNHEHS